MGNNNIYYNMLVVFQCWLFQMCNYFISLDGSREFQTLCYPTDHYHSLFVLFYFYFHYSTGAYGSSPLLVRFVLICEIGYVCTVVFIVYFLTSLLSIKRTLVPIYHLLPLGFFTVDRRGPDNGLTVEGAR